eukprot:gene16214-biopygen11280
MLVSKKVVLHKNAIFTLVSQWNHSCQLPEKVEVHKSAGITPLPTSLPPRPYSVKCPSRCWECSVIGLAMAPSPPLPEPGASPRPSSPRWCVLGKAARAHKSAAPTWCSRAGH